MVVGVFAIGLGGRAAVQKRSATFGARRALALVALAHRREKPRRPTKLISCLLRRRAPAPLSRSSQHISSHHDAIRAPAGGRDRARPLQVSYHSCRSSPAPAICFLSSVRPSHLVLPPLTAPADHINRSTPTQTGPPRRRRRQRRRRRSGCCPPLLLLRRQSRPALAPQPLFSIPLPPPRGEQAPRSPCSAWTGPGRTPKQPVVAAAGSPAAKREEAAAAAKRAAESGAARATATMRTRKRKEKKTTRAPQRRRWTMTRPSWARRKSASFLGERRGGRCS